MSTELNFWTCVECGGVFTLKYRRCPICEHGPENSQPGMLRIEPLNDGRFFTNDEGYRGKS